MRILLDENFPIQLHRQLLADGHEAEHIITLGLRGATDAEIRLRLGVEADVLFLSQDTEFADLAADTESKVMISRGCHRDCRSPTGSSFGGGRSRGSSPTPLDPATWSALQRVLAARESSGTLNRHVVVTRATKTRSTPASTPYLTHLLDDVGIPPQRIRVSRIAELVVGLDPKVVASALGMNDTGMIRYLADAVYRDRLTAVPT